MPKKAKLKPGMVIGHKKMLRLEHKLGEIEYWKIRCLICNREEILHEVSCANGRKCRQCRKENFNLWLFKDH
jgi:hypothetical protein